ncbi:MAG TPA: DALR domain-containing protein, partial [Candidatus Thermoplasmatota archaeon]|nr:DALR domain-containing protein [Candidatus Thermoplasmatota archaeon]
ENELAQSESANGKPFVRYWIHAGFLTVEGVKMSKSLGNFTTVRAALAEWRPEALRLWFAGTHYRSQIDYSLAGLEQASKNVERFATMLTNARHAKAGARSERRKEDDAFVAAMQAHLARFEAAMDDDLNTPVALAVLFDMATEVNRHLADPHAGALDEGLAVFHAAASVFDVLPDGPEETAGDSAPLLGLLLELREAARARKDFATSDLIRDRLSALGYAIEDAGKGKGPRWRRK